jgi:hypothetical protein
VSPATTICRKNPQMAAQSESTASRMSIWAS